MDIQNKKAEPNKWLELYGDIMYQYTLPRVNDTATAEDLVQETFLSALKGLDGYRGEASEKNWLFSILKNKIIDHYRKKAKGLSINSKQDLPDMDTEWFSADGHWNATAAPSNWHASNNLAETKELQRIISTCKEKLKALHQDVFTLKYMEDIDSAEICKVLEITSSNYWIILHRARLQMRDCVEKKWVKN